MRRGLMGWNAEELPVATLEARLAKLRAAMAKAGMDAFVIYTNNTRPSAVNHVTGFTPYWSDALMLVGKSGAPVFATALSKRVSEWIRTTDPLSEIVNTPRPGTLIGERLAKGCGQARRRAGIRHAAVGTGRRHGRGGALRGMDRRHDAVCGLAPRSGPIRARASGARRRNGYCSLARGRSRQGQRCRHARRPDRAARAACGRRGNLHRGRARSRRGSSAQPHLAADAADGSLRGPRFDCLQGLLGSPHADICEGRGQGRCVVRRRRAFARSRQANRDAARGESEGASWRDASQAGWPRAASAAIRCPPSPRRACPRKTRRRMDNLSC